MLCKYDFAPAIWAYQKSGNILPIQPSFSRRNDQRYLQGCINKMISGSQLDDPMPVIVIRILSTKYTLPFPAFGCFQEKVVSVYSIGVTWIYLILNDIKAAHYWAAWWWYPLKDHLRGRWFWNYFWKEDDLLLRGLRISLGALCFLNSVI